MSEQWGEKIAAAKAAYAAAKARKRAAAARVTAADDGAAEAAEAAEVLRGAARAVMQTAHARIADVATRCLATVYDDSYEFHIEFQEKRGRTEAEAQLRRGGHTFDPKEDVECGVLDVAALALRLAALNARRPAPRRLLVLDEPFRFVDRPARGRVGALLAALCEESGLQIIMATHWDELKIGKVIEL